MGTTYNYGSHLDKTKEELLEELPSLIKNVRRRIERIEQQEDLPQWGAESFRGFERRLKDKLDGKNLSSLSVEDLRTVYRDISYISNLKSTTYWGAVKARDVYLPLKEKLETLSPNLRKKFQAVYNMVVEDNALRDRFKYEINEFTFNEMLQGEIDEERITFEIKRIHDEILERLGSKYDERKEKVLFTNKLRTLQK